MDQIFHPAAINQNHSAASCGTSFYSDRELKST
jgi:hypothetical protein